MQVIDRPKQRFPGNGTLLLVMIAMLVVVGALSVWIPHYHKQVALAKMERAGAIVNTTPGGPHWLREWGEFSVFDTAVSVDLSHCEVDDELLRYVSTLTSLNQLSLNGEHLSDTGFENLKRMPNLKVLRLYKTRVTETRLKQISELSKLRDLSFNNSEITQRAFEQLHDLHSVQWLYFRDTSVTTEGLEYLRRLTWLKGMVFVGSNVSMDEINRLRSEMPACQVAYGSGPSE